MLKYIYLLSTIWLSSLIYKDWELIAFRRWKQLHSNLGVAAALLFGLN